MSQYYPAYRTTLFGEINRKISLGEYERAVKKSEELGLFTGWTQPFEGDFDETLHGESFRPL